MAVVDEEKQIMSTLNKRPLTKPAVYYMQGLYTENLAIRLNLELQSLTHHHL